jgi:hypothetical protein
MPDRRLSALRVVLVVVGLILVGVFSLPPVARGLELGNRTLALLVYDPWGLRDPGRVPADGVAGTAGPPEPHLVRGVAWVGGGVADPAERGQLLGDVPALLIVAIALAVLTPAPGSHARA